MDFRLNRPAKAKDDRNANSFNMTC